MQHRPDIRANKAAFPEKDIGDEPGDTFLPARQRTPCTDPASNGGSFRIHGSIPACLH